MRDGERRKLVFCNLLNGHSVPAVMAALRLSEKEVRDDFDFVARKVRSYQFERVQPPIPCDTIETARPHRVALLWLVTRLNLETIAVHRNVVHVPLSKEPGRGMSEWELRLLEMRARAGGGRG